MAPAGTAGNGPRSRPASTALRCRFRNVVEPPRLLKASQPSLHPILRQQRHDFENPNISRCRTPPPPLAERPRDAKPLVVVLVIQPPASAVVQAPADRRRGSAAD